MDKKILVVLDELEAQSELERSGKVDVFKQERMLAITQDTGVFFNILLKATKCRRILEVGTSTGYSTLWFADAIISNDPLNAKIITVEQNPSKIQRAQNNFQRAGISKIVSIQKGVASEILEKISNAIEKGLQPEFDFVFLDADKENLKMYFDMALPLVRKGGIIATDNLNYPEHYNKTMQEYVKHIRNNKKVQSVTVPIGNGEEITYKIR